MEQNEEQRTALEGSEPLEGQPSDSPTDTGATTAPPDAEDLDENGRPLPYDKDPKWKSARKAEKELSRLLEENELDSVEDLVELVKSGKAVVGKGLDEDRLEGLIARATKMDQVEEYWAQQREEQRRLEEDPEQTAARLERENAELKQRLSGKNELDASKRALEAFEKKTRTFIEGAVKDADKDDKAAFEFFMGVNHPFGEIDITDERQINKMGKQVLKTIEGIEQRAIKKYVEGKKNLVKIGSTSAPAAPGPQGGIRGLKDARAALRDYFRVK